MVWDLTLYEDGTDGWTEEGSGGEDMGVGVGECEGWGSLERRVDHVKASLDDASERVKRLGKAETLMRNDKLHKLSVVHLPFD